MYHIIVAGITRSAVLGTAGSNPVRFVVTSSLVGGEVTSLLVARVRKGLLRESHRILEKACWLGVPVACALVLASDTSKVVERAVGLGTYRLTGEEAYAATLCALQCGYRLIDTASIYKNHEMIGKAIRESGVPRQDIFVTSKVSPYEQGAEKAPKAAKSFLEQLGLEYLDQLLIHWPGIAKEPHSSPKHASERLGSWVGLQALKEEGLVKSLGVSNFEIKHLEHLVEHSGVVPDVNQVELHPRFQQLLREYCSKHGIQVVAYSSLGSGNLIAYGPVVKAAAGADVSRTLLRWALQQELVVLPRSSKLDRIKATAPQHLLYDAPLPDSTIEELDACDDGTKYCWNPEGIMI